MSAVRTTIIKPRNIYTQMDLPWQIGDDPNAPKDKLFKLLVGGGLSAFGTSNAKQLAAIRQNRFLKFAAAFAALWTLFLFL